MVEDSLPTEKCYQGRMSPHLPQASLRSARNIYETEIYLHL